MSITKRGLKNFEKRLIREGKIPKSEVVALLMGGYWYNDEIYESLKEFETANKGLRNYTVRGKPLLNLTKTRRVKDTL